MDSLRYGRFFFIPNECTQNWKMKAIQSFMVMDSEKLRDKVKQKNVPERLLFKSISFWPEYFISKLIYYYLMCFGLLILFYGDDWLCDFSYIGLLLNSLPFRFYVSLFFPRCCPYCCCCDITMEPCMRTTAMAMKISTYILTPPTWPQNQQ